MKRALPWFWTEWQMPKREVWKLSASDMDEYLEQAQRRRQG